MLVEAINFHLLSRKESDRPVFGLSGIGSCKRKLAYLHHKVAAKPLSARSKIIFDDGHVTHEHLRSWLAAGLLDSKSCYTLVDLEREVTLGGTKGHIDGILFHSTSCQEKDHKTRLLEVKSMNNRAFKEFQKTKIPSFEYAAQMSAYLRATGLQEAYVLAKDKDRATLVEAIYPIDNDLIDNRQKAVEEVRKSSSPEMVQREYGPSDKGVLPWNCGYCPFVELCWRHEGVIEIAEHVYKITKHV